MQLPEEYHTSYEAGAENVNTAKTIQIYVERMAEENRFLIEKKANDHFKLRSIIPFLRTLNYYGYYAYPKNIRKKPGLITEVDFIIEDRNGPSVFRGEVTLSSDDFDDYEKLVQGQILEAGGDGVSHR